MDGAIVLIAAVADDIEARMTPSGTFYTILEPSSADAGALLAGHFDPEIHPDEAVAALGSVGHLGILDGEDLASRSWGANQVEVAAAEFGKLLGGDIDEHVCLHDIQTFWQLG